MAIAPKSFYPRSKLSTDAKKSLFTCGYDFEGSSELQKISEQHFLSSFLQLEHLEVVFVVAAGVKQVQQKHIDIKNSELKLMTELY